jgi:uncharacterized protein YjbI with pentapeptide repeats
VPKSITETITYLQKNSDRWAAFQQWWDEDWSWDGLPEKLHLQREDKTPASLQDYWHDQEDALVEFAGRRWTLVHLPPCDRDGNIYPDWLEVKAQAFWNAIEARLPDVTVPIAEAVFVEKIIPQPALLYGVVFPEWRTSLRSKIISAHFDKSVFLGWCNFSKSRIANSFFDSAKFIGDTTDFDSAEFLTGAHFSEAQILSSSFVSFSETKFEGEAHFRRSKINSPNFRRARFSDGCDFSDVKFENGGPYFIATEFGGGYAHFDRVICDGVADFSFAKFDTVVSFEDAEFKYDAYFRCDKGGKFAAAADFNGAVFNQTADFSGRSFNQTTDFRGARFNGLPMFYDCELIGETLFDMDSFAQQPWLAPLTERTLEHEIERDNRERVRRRQMRFNDHYFGRRHITTKDLSTKVPFKTTWNKRAKSFELSFRALRRLSANVGNVDDEMNFHSLELDARRSRTDVAPFERGIITSYKLFSDYGRSMWRPVWTFIAIAALTVSLATPCTWRAIDQHILTQKGIAVPSGTSVAMYVARNFIPPPPVWSESLGRTWAVGLDDGAQVLLLLLGTLQALTFLSFVALFLIVLRRRFRIRD